MQAGRAEGDLTGVGMYVEAATLGTRTRRSVTFENGDGVAMLLQDARAGKSAEAGADNRDAGGVCGVHGSIPLKGT
ncbi:hypothetical protein GCM10010339_77750 [Streptomyces alanosinicus]|uniref:Uncharacterized protein n=1 Tax=Streptomyces alanosinicus TaxID=68171 RepID=A0A918YQL3_9ACTN|nr:hypothetical protein GCM10010339_77750 [Streptomyces alanosinicus]